MEEVGLQRRQGLHCNLGEDDALQPEVEVDQVLGNILCRTTWLLEHGILLSDLVKEACG